MKKLLFWILTLLWIWLSFCSADTFYWNSFSCYLWTPISWYIQCNDDVLNFWNWNNITSWEYILTVEVTNWLSFEYIWGFIPYIWGVSSAYNTSSAMWYFFSCSESFPCREFNPYYYYNIVWEWLVTFTVVEFQSDIDVYYNNWNSVENITCDWTQAIDIRWLSTITSTNTFTPYYNISYTDKDNQKLIESYSKDILYLSGWLFKKTYTWDNERILTYQWSSENTFTWYVPVFDVTWTINENTWNMFNNFTDNVLTLLLSNIPIYVQWVTLIAVLFLILWIIRRFKRH